MRRTAMAVAAAALLSGPVPAAEDTVLVRVDGTAITATMAEIYVRERTGGRAGYLQLPAEERRRALDDLVNLVLLAREARRRGLDREPATAARLRVRETDALARALLARVVESDPVGEEELRHAYEARYAGRRETEYRVRHILVADEARARAVIGRLEAGEDFANVARDVSLDPSGEAGGDLGWLAPAAMEPPFRAAVEALEPGGFTKTPVRTRYGFHVVRLEARREAGPPPFESVRRRLAQELATERLRAYVRGLREKARIEMRGGAP